MRWLAILAMAAGVLHGQGVQEHLRAAAGRRPAPEFALADAAGKTVGLSSFRGKVVLLDLWATNCAGCAEEMPFYMELQRRYVGKKLAVVGVSMEVLYEDLPGAEEGWRRVKPFVAAKGIRYPILMGDEAFAKRYAVKALPVTYLIDWRGRVAAVYRGVANRRNLVKNIRELLEERW